MTTPTGVIEVMFGFLPPNVSLAVTHCCVCVRCRSSRYHERHCGSNSVFTLSGDCSSRRQGLYWQECALIVFSCMFVCVCSHMKKTKYVGGCVCMLHSLCYILYASEANTVIATIYQISKCFVGKHEHSKIHLTFSELCN